MTMTANELANKIIALLNGKTYGEAEEALQTAASFLAENAKDLISKTTVAIAQNNTPPRTSRFYSAR